MHTLHLKMATFLPYNIQLIKMMGNQIQSLHPACSTQNMDLLCSLIYSPCHTNVPLPFEPFFDESETVNVRIALQTRNEQNRLAASYMKDEREETLSKSSKVQNTETTQSSQKSRVSELQKIQFSNNRNGGKTKQIRKQPNRAGKRVQEESEPEKVEFNFSEEEKVDEETHQHIMQETIRDQNNCKSYHKLVKNYLIEKNLESQIMAYNHIFHTRYYFIIALMLVKHHLAQDFVPIYYELAQKEILLQEKRIEKKNAEIEKINLRITQLRGRRTDPSQFIKEKACIKSQISHIQVVISEIAAFSINSCRAFFEGKLQDSLKILYTKDDKEMKKKYYFTNALMILEDVEKQLKKKGSHI